VGARRETELYGPVKQFIERQGFEVRGEVVGCDLVAVREDELVVIELKTTFTLALILQGITRQRLTEVVYVAVEAPKSRRSEPRWSDLQHLCHRLGLGLLTVSFRGRVPRVEAVLDPAPYQPRIDSRRRGKLLKEFALRSGDHNIGGSTRRKIVTAYREDALRLAQHLHLQGRSTPRDLKRETGCSGAAQILRKDYYGWFERVERGVYQLTPVGKRALEVYADVLQSNMQTGISSP
jgi:hypothetical protein